MADNNNNQQGQQFTDNMLHNVRRASRGSTNDVLSDAIYDLIDELQGNPQSFRQRTQAPHASQSNFSENSNWNFYKENPRNPSYRSRGNLLDDFENGIKEQLLDSLAGGNFKKNLQGALTQFTKEFGFDIRNVGYEAGKQLMGKVADAFNKSKFGQNINKGAADLGNSILNTAFKGKGPEGQAALSGLKNVFKAFKGGGIEGAKLAGSAAAAGGASSAAGGAASAAASGLIKGAASLGPWGLLIAGIIFTVVKVLGPALKGLGEVVKALGKSFNREEELRKKRLEEAKKRLQDDVNYITEEPFKILKEAVDKWTTVWDSNLSTVGQTQGYDKQSVYALYEGYADRLRKDNLDSVIKATDIVDKLSSVLSSGLSGEVAEEFAYAATKLNAAIPTQDFFGYVDSYSSIAANAIAQGKSQSEAIAEANAQLEQFASNLLYSSRELAGGFSTGLKNGANLFKEAVEIAQTAKTYNAATISGTLTSVSAIIGAVAPDLADSLVSNVVQAAIGGNNNSSLVALRSLAGVNAGNTEFLRAMAEDPQKIFSSLFTNLAQMQNMSPDNYMEVAEGLADVFGIDRGAFARVDFNYLANAIESMRVNNQSLAENMALLESGQTTTSAEQLKAQEINRVILDEGLAYVIDNEAGRMIQEHMWDEQRAVEMMNATYAVDLQGSALSFLEGIRKSITTLLNFLNPVGFIAKGVANMTQTIAESIGNDQDIKDILRLGAVGSNAKAFYNLTTRGKDLNLTTSLAEMMGGTSSQGIRSLSNLNRAVLNGASNLAMAIALPGIGGFIPTSDEFNSANDRLSGILGTAYLGHTGGAGELGPNAKLSRYSWGTVGKSVARALQSTAANTNLLGEVAGVSNATQLAQASSNKRFQSFLDTAKDAAATMSYEQWVATASSRGILDFSKALEDYGRTEDELRAYFESNEAAQGAAIEQSRKEDEQKFRDENRTYWDYSSGTSGVFQTSMWLPFFGDGQKYDTRMDIVDSALTDIQFRIGAPTKHTVISGLEEISTKIGDNPRFTVLSLMELIERDISDTFMSPASAFQQCLADWVRYIAEANDYSTSVSKSTAWNDLKNAEKDQQTQATLALANALNVFSADELKKLDPQLQTNVLLGEIVLLLQTIQQQGNSFSGLTLPDSFSALSLGLTQRT